MPVERDGDRTSTDWKRRVRGAGLNVLLAAGSGALTSLAFAPLEWWPVALVSLVPLLIALRRTTAIRAAGWLALVWALAFHATSMHWLAAIFGASVPAIFILISLPWFLFGAGYRLVQRSVPQAAVIAAPVMWVAVDWIRCEGWYFKFSWGQLGFAPAPTATALYATLGVYGLTLVFVLVNAILVSLVAGPRGWTLAAAVTLLPAALMTLVTTLDAPPPGTVGRAAVVQQGNGDLDELERLTREAAAQDARLIAWPETAVRETLLNDPELRARLSALAHEVGATLVVGGWQTAPEDAPIDWLRRHAMRASGKGMLYNAALVIAADGTILGSYHKTHPIQFFADGVPGREYPVFSGRFRPIGVAICYDFDYAATARRLVQGGAKVIVVPTVDSEDWPEVQHLQHARIVQARAAEAACPVVKPAMFGISQIISESGRVRASIPSGEVGVAVASYEFYGKDLRMAIDWPWLPHLCLALSLLLVAGAPAGARGQAAKSGA